MSDAEPETRLPETERLLDAAAAELRRERRRASDELEALRTFESRIRSVSVEESSHGTAPRGNGLLVSPDGGNRLDVLEEKCETVSDRRQTEVFEQRRFGWLPALLV